MKLYVLKNIVPKMDKKDKEDKDNDGRIRKQQCDNVSLLGEETKGKHRRNWYHIISAHQKYDHPAREHPDYLAVYVMKKLQKKQ